MSEAHADSADPSNGEASTVPSVSKPVDGATTLHSGDTLSPRRGPRSESVWQQESLGPYRFKQSADPNDYHRTRTLLLAEAFTGPGAPNRPCGGAWRPSGARDHH